jgi:hypothetical protein
LGEFVFGLIFRPAPLAITLGEQVGVRASILMADYAIDGHKFAARADH